MTSSRRRGSARYELAARTAVARYGVAALLAVGAVVVARVLLPQTDGSLYSLQVGAVAVAVWYGGFGPGLLAAALGWSLSPLVMAQAGFGFEEQEIRWASSLVVGLLVVWVSVVMRRAQARAATAAVAAEESTRQMAAIQELTSALSAAVTPTDVARELIRRTPPLLGARGGSLGLIEGDDVVVVDPAGIAPQTHRPGLRLSLERRAPITLAAAEGELKRAEDRTTFEARFPDGAALTPYAQAAIAVPLRVGGDVVGSLSFLFDRPQAAHEEAEAIALIAADLGGQALERAMLYEREQRSREALDHLVRVAPRLYSGSAEEIRVEICREARGLLGTDMTEIWRVDADLEWLGLVCRDPEDESQRGDERLRIAELRGLREAAETLEVVFAPDAEAFAHGDALQHVRTHGIRSWLWVPIPVGGQAQQLLFFSWQTALRETDPSTMLLARRFSDHAGVALEQLERRQAEEEAARRAVEVRRLLDSTAALSAATTPSEVTRAILHEGLRSLGAARGVVVCVTGDGDALEIVDSDGYRPETLEPWRVFPLDADVPLAEAARENRLVAVESPEELAERFPALGQNRTEPTSSWLSVPLTAAGSVLGAAGFSFTQVRSFSKAELEFAEALARQAGQALERALLLAAEYAARTRAEDMVALTSALSQAVSTAEVLRAVELQISERMSADTGIYLLEEGVGLELVGTNGTSLWAGEPGLRRLALDSGAPPAECARRRRPIWVETDDEWTGYEDAETWRSAGVGRLGAVPLLVDERLLGVLAVAFELDGRIEVEARALVESIARQTSHALERAWLMEREQAARVAAERASRRTRLLQSITQALAAAPAPHDVAEIIVREALAAVSGDAVALFAFDTTSEAPKVLAEVGFGGEASADDLAASVTDAALRGSLVVVDAESPIGLPENALRDAIGATGLRAAVCVPLGVGLRAIGALLVCFRAADELSAEDTELVQTLARIGAQALERSRLFDDEQRLRHRSERIQAMSESLSGSLTQRDVAEVVVDALVLGAGADAAAFSAVVEDRRVQKKLAWRGYDSEAQEPWLEIPLRSPTPGNSALRTGSVIFYETLKSLAADFPAAAERMRITGHESFLFVPLFAGGRANGLVVTSWAERVTLGAEDRSFIETLAVLAAQALDRARLVESDRTIAETLQRSVLPVSLPLVPNVQLAARYLPGTGEVDVGGDWFDAIPLSNGRLGLAVGDVVGKGVQAAATMAQLRNGLRAFALDCMKPSSTIARLNRLSEEMSESAFATLVYAVLDPELGVCRLTSAGHPPPLVIRPDGRAEYVEGGRGLPLGTGPDVRYTQDRIDLPVGSTLILYTDGLVERRSEPIDVGLERLREAAESAAGNPERVVEHILARLVGGEGRGDDIAVLVVRLLAVAPKPLDLRLPTAPRSLDLVRDALRAWLEYAPATQTEAHDVVLATWEACANAIEHPDRKDGNGRFGVRAELEESAVTVTVTDCGRWLAETERPDRGLGLRLIEAVMTSVEIDVTDDRTSVRLAKQLAGEEALALS